MKIVRYNIDKCFYVRTNFVIFMYFTNIFLNICNGFYKTIKYKNRNYIINRFIDGFYFRPFYI